MPIKLSLDETKIKAQPKHGDCYEYVDIYSKNGRTFLGIICNKHGRFEQRAENHFKGQQCPLCANEHKSSNKIEFMKKANIKHNNRYGYDDFIYTNNYTASWITCFNHGNFLQIPNDHLHGRGCPKCGIEKRTSNKEKFIERAILIHKNIYDYSKFIYINNRIKGIIICSSHGDFEQTPHGHLSGRGCPKCRSSISKMEIEWLNYLQIPETYRQKIITVGDKFYKVDAYDPIITTVYEFNGDFWHGNPEVFDQNDINYITKTTFGYLFNNTINKKQQLEAAGYQVISIWQKDWLKIKNIL